MLSEVNSLKGNIQRRGKFIDMSLLPSGNSVLILHIKRSIYAAKILKSSLTNWLDPDG